MRLTLRTLLAWIDGVLPEGERAELGSKVEASPVARQLAERIEGVIGNDLLDAPRTAAKGLVADPNTVAEYLDNALANERLEAFETICLESDQNLAEVAACHRILAEVACDPAVIVPLDPAGRRALLDSIAHRLQTPSDILLAGAAAPRGRIDRFDGRGTATGAGKGSVAARPAAMEPAPTARRRTPAAAWALLASSLAVVVALGLLFLRSTGMLGVSPTPRAGARQDDLAAADAPPKPDAADAGNAGAAAPDLAGDVAAGDVAAAQPVDAPQPPGDAAGPQPRGLADLLAQADAADAAAAQDPATGAAAGATADAPTLDDVAAAPPMDDAVPDNPAERSAPPPDAVASIAAGPTKIRAGDALAIAAGARSPRPARNMAPAPAAPDVAAAVGLDGPQAGKGIGFVAADGAVLRRVALGDLVTWEPVGENGGLPDGAEVVVPPGMRPEINLGGVSVRCDPGTILRVSLGDDSTPEVEVILGRAVCRSARGDGRLGLRAGALAGTVVSGLDDGVAAEVVSRGRPGDGPGLPATSVRILAVRGPVGWQGAGSDAAAPTTIDVGGAIRAPEGPEAGEEDAAPEGGAEGTRIEPLERGAAETFLRRLAELPEGTRPSDGLAGVLEGMAIDRRVENRVFAATTLALLGDYDVAADLLCAEASGRRLEGRQWRMLESAVVPLALSRGEASAERLRRAWEDRGPPGRAPLLDAMARRPTDADLAAGADRMLVEALGDGSLVVRRAALVCLEAIVRPGAADRARFRPDGTEDSRREGAAWWRTQQERGLVRRPRAETP